MKIFPSSIINNSIESHFIENTTKSKIIYTVVIVAIVILFVSTFFIKIEISSQSREQVRSTVENNSIHSCVYGQILKVNLQENLAVSAGDTIVWLDTKSIDEKIALNKAKVQENEIFISDLKLLINNQISGFVSPKYISEFMKYFQEIKESDINIQYLENEYKIARSLFEQKALAKSEYDQIKNKYSLSCSNLKLLKYKYKVNWTSTLKEFEIQTTELLSENSQLKNEKRQYLIIAPISGTIMNYKGIAKDGFIAPSQVIAEISSENNLVVEAYISPKDIGFITNKMKVKYQFDTYDYNQWGLGTGEVYEISRDAIQIDKNIAFKVKCKLNEQFLELKNGYKGNITKGMTTTVRFYITERSLFQLLYDKVDDWLNPRIK